MQTESKRREPRIAARLEEWDAESLDYWSDELIEGVHVRGAQFPDHVREIQGLVIRGSRFTSVSFTERDFRDVRMQDVVYEDCDLSGSVWDSARIDRVTFRRCRLTGAVWSGAQLKDVLIEECTAQMSSWRMAQASRVQCVDSVLKSMDFSYMTMDHSDLVDSDLRDATFEKARLTHVSLVGSKVDDLHGAQSLGGTRVTFEQGIVLGHLLLRETGITVAEHGHIRE